MTSTILIFSNDVPPLAGAPASGGGIRVRGLVEGLRQSGLEVHFSVPESKLRTLSARSTRPVRKLAFESGHLDDIVRRVDPDVILVEQWALANSIEPGDLPLVVDLHGSLMVENHYRRHRDLRHNATAKLKALQRADLVLCAGEIQRRYFQAWLLLSGFEPDELRLETIPVLFDPEPPRRQPSRRRRTLLFGGTCWPWVQPFPFLEIAAEEVWERRDWRLKVFHGATGHAKVLPHDSERGIEVDSSIFQKLSGPNVEVAELTSHARFLDECRRATLAIDVFQHNLERELAFSTRSAEYLWAGLPLLHADYDEIGQWIAERDAGWAVDVQDPDGFRSQLRSILDDPDTIPDKSANARALASERLSWDDGIEPLARFCEAPVRRRKAAPLFKRLHLSITDLEEAAARRGEAAEREIRSLRGVIENHKKDLEEREQALLEQRGQLDGHQSEIEGLRAEIAGRDHHIRELVQERDALSRKIEQDKDYRKEIEGRDHYIHELREQRDALKRQYDGDIQKIRYLAEERALLAEKRSDDEQRRAESWKQRWEETRQQTEEAVRAFEGTIRELEGTIREAEGTIRELEESSRRELEGAVQAEQQRHGVEIARLREATDEERGRRDALQADLLHRERDLANLQREHAQLQADLDQVCQALAALEGRGVVQIDETLRHLLRRGTVQLPAFLEALSANLSSTAYRKTWEALTKRKIFPGT